MYILMTANTDTEGAVKMYILMTANTDTEGAVKNVHINGVSVLNRLNLEKMEGLSFPRDEANCQVM